MWKFKGAKIQRRTAAANGPVVGAAVTIYDDAAQALPDELPEAFLARSHHTYRYTRRPDQTPEQFQTFVKFEVKAHIDHRNAAEAAAGFWTDAPELEVS